jgi:deferrochelatase/peroxidase EfeB
MIDPITALAGIQSAVALIKKVSKTVDDVSSLGPVLGKYFDAKSTATKAVVQAKNSGKKSSMAAAVEIEMAIHQAEEFEKQLQLLFMQTGKIDVWIKIKSRAQAMDVEAAHQARREKEAAIRQRQKNQEMIEIVFGIFLIVVVFVGVIWGAYEIVHYCKYTQCGN